MRKKIILILSFIFIFILSSCESKKYIPTISNIEEDNILNDIEFKNGDTSSVYMCDNSRKVYYYFDTENYLDIIIDDSFLSERIFYIRKSDETDEEAEYNAYQLEKEDEFYRFDKSTNEFYTFINKSETKNIISTDITYNKESLLEYVSNTNNDTLINPNFVVKAITDDLKTSGFLGYKIDDTLNLDCQYYKFYMRQTSMRSNDSKFFKVMEEKYMTEEEYKYYMFYIENHIYNPVGSIAGNFDLYLSISKDELYLYPTTSMLYSSGNKRRYFFNIDTLNKYELYYGVGNEIYD